MEKEIRPNHYKKGGLECFEFIKALIEGKSGLEAFYLGNVAKYLWRYGEKNGIEDLRKSITYTNMLIKEIRPRYDTN